MISVLIFIVPQCTIATPPAGLKQIMFFYMEMFKRFFSEIQKLTNVRVSPWCVKTLAILDRFKSKLSSAISETPETPEDEDELEEDDDKGW